MSKIIVEKLFDRDITYQGCPECRKKECEHDVPRTSITFKVYTALCEGRYFELQGYGSKNAQVGDKLEGEIEEYPYKNKDGIEKKGYRLIMSRPVSQIVQEIKKLIKGLDEDTANDVWKQVKGKEVEPLPEPHGEEIDLDDIPF